MSLLFKLHFVGPFVTYSQGILTDTVISYYMLFYQLPVKVRVLLLSVLHFPTRSDWHLEVKLNQCLLNKQIDECVLKQIVSVALNR